MSEENQVPNDKIGFKKDVDPDLERVQLNVNSDQHIKAQLKQDQCRVGQFQKVTQKESEILKSSYKKLPRFKKLEILFEVISLIVFIIMWIYFKSLVPYDDLPQQVPVEFDINGKPVRKQRKEFLYSFPGIESITYIIFTVLQFVPHRFKYTYPLTVWNAQDVYRTTRILLLYMKLVTLLMFNYLIFMMFRVVTMSEQPRVMYYVFAFAIPYIIGAARYYQVIKKLTRG